MSQNRLAGPEFVESFLETGEITEEQITGLIADRAPEDDRLEYKGGDWLTAKEPKPRRGHPSTPGKRLGKYATGFANAGGGVLLVGIKTYEDMDKDIPEKVDPDTCKAWDEDGDRLLAKAKDSLQSVQARHVTPLRIAVVRHTDGLVLAVGVERAPELISQEESGGVPLYYMRTFDGTQALPDLVAADLLVGRRARPTVDVQVQLEQGSSGREGIDLTVILHVVNVGPVWIEGLRAGVVFHGATPPPARAPIQGWLPREVDAADPAHLVHVAADEVNHDWRALPPMATVSCSAQVRFPGSMGAYQMAVYVVAQGHPPS